MLVLKVSDGLRRDEATVFGISRWRDRVGKGKRVARRVTNEEGEKFGEVC